MSKHEVNRSLVIATGNSGAVAKAALDNMRKFFNEALEEERRLTKQGLTEQAAQMKKDREAAIAALTPKFQEIEGNVSKNATSLVTYKTKTDATLADLAKKVVVLEGLGGEERSKVWQMVEQALGEFLTSAKIAEIAKQLSINVWGASVPIASAVAFIATAPQIADIKRSDKDRYGIFHTLKVEFVDGKEAVLTASFERNEQTGVLSYRSDDFLNSGFVAVTNTDILTFDEYDVPEGVSETLYLTYTMAVDTEGAINPTAPDLDGDGQIGETDEATSTDENAASGIIG